MKHATVVNFAPAKGSVEIREVETPSIGSLESVILQLSGTTAGFCWLDDLTFESSPDAP
jgi:hypothetical protein